MEIKWIITKMDKNSEKLGNNLGKSEEKTMVEISWIPDRILDIQTQHHYYLLLLLASSKTQGNPSIIRNAIATNLNYWITETAMDQQEKKKKRMDPYLWTQIATKKFIDYLGHQCTDRYGRYPAYSGSRIIPSSLLKASLITNSPSYS